MSEATEKKARQYLTEGRVRLLEADAEGCTVLVQGSADKPYHVVFNGAWTCDCPARVSPCSHIMAAQLVTPYRVGHKVFLAHDHEIDTLIGGS